MLIAERRLIRVRCMRQTLHILPLELAATAHHATLRQRLAPCRARLRQLGHSERAFRVACARVRGAIADAPIPYRELEARAGSPRRQLSLIRLAIKWLWETGELAHVDLSPSLHHEHRAFVRTEAHYPDLRLRSEAADLMESCDELVYRHLHAFGPASIADTAWWSGLGRGTVRDAVARASGEFVPVAVDGVRDELLVAEGELVRLRNAEPLNPRHVTLLAYEDPALKGYFATRERYVRARDYHALFNSIGEARASILVGGEAVGVWAFERDTGRIKHELWRRVSRASSQAITERLEDMTAFFASEPRLA
jgi:winged helix DNA-binding protein